MDKETIGQIRERRKNPDTKKYISIIQKYLNNSLIEQILSVSPDQKEHTFTVDDRFHLIDSEKFCETFNEIADKMNSIRIKPSARNCVCALLEDRRYPY